MVNPFDPSDPLFFTPLQGNDVTDFWKAGGDLREWVSKTVAANLPESLEMP